MSLVQEWGQQGELVMVTVAQNPDWPGWGTGLETVSTVRAGWQDALAKYEGNKEWEKHPVSLDHIDSPGD